MQDSFCGGMKASNYSYLRRIYEYENISEEMKNEYMDDLKKNKPEIYSEVIELKNILEKDIVNVKEVLLYGQKPILGIDIGD